jgi:hypothetical protein
MITEHECRMDRKQTLYTALEIGVWVRKHEKKVRFRTNEKG